MPMKINFDTSGNPEVPIIALVDQSERHIGIISNFTELKIQDNLKEPSTISFTLHKNLDNEEYKYWNEVKNFRLIYIPDWDKYFVIKITINEDNEVQKQIEATSIQETELGQLLLHNQEINTETDISRDDYVKTVLYNPGETKGSLLNRLIKDKASNYTVLHVDDSIKNIQRSFSFDDTSIYDAFQSISEEIDCIFIFGERPEGDTTTTIPRTISVYDLESNCKDCGYRGEFMDQCPKCGSTNIKEGYGEDTTIFTSKENIAESISVSSDTDSVKNCFYLQSGDDLMTSTIINANPSGSQYIWYFTDEMKADMSDELQSKLESYDKQYSYYQSDYEAELNDDIIQKYNDLVIKYREYNSDLKVIQPPVRGYSSLIELYYDAIDFYGYLYTSLTPSVKIDKTTANDQAKLLTSESLSPISVQNIKYISLATANSSVVNYAKVFIDTARYKIKVKNSSIDNVTWTGVLTVENYYDEDDTADTEMLMLVFDSDVERFVKQEIDKALAKNKEEDKGIVSLFKKDTEEFQKELTKYSYTNLQILNDACQSCLNIMIENNDSAEDSWDYTEGNIYKEIYLPMCKKQELISSELKLREEEISVINGITDEYGDVSTKGLKNYIEDLREKILKELDFQNYIGDCWGELNLFRREDTWSNDNYISDGLSNKELLDNAKKFLEAATKDIKKSSELQNSIDATLKNLLIKEEFAPITKYFKTGNWLRMQVDDVIYKLRLLNYSIDFDNISDLSVEFSDTTKDWGNIKDIQNVLSKSKQMATSYTSVKRQAEKSVSTKSTVDEWVQSGINANITKIMSGDNQDVVVDKHGITCRKWDPILNGFEDDQMKIINSMLVYTHDGWQTYDAALGSFEFYNPKTKQTETGYGVIAKQLVGSVILGENIGIYNKSGSLSFDEDGLAISNGTNSFNVDPNSKNLLTISKGDDLVFGVTNEGNLTYTGVVTSTKLVLTGEGLNETNGKNTVKILPTDSSIFTLSDKDKKVLYFDNNNVLNFSGNITASSLTLGDNVKISSSHITGLKDFLELDTVVGNIEPYNDSPGFSLQSNGQFVANKSLLYNPSVTTKYNDYYSGIGAGPSPFLFAGSSSSDFSDPVFSVNQDGTCNAKILNTNDAWDEKSNVVTSDTNQKIKIKYSDETVQIYSDKQLVMSLTGNKEDITTDNITQGVNEFILDAGTA